MQYQVPQFIEVEDKIIGPFTMKQFLYLGGGCGLSYLAYAYLPSFISFILIPILFGLGIALAFVKIQGRPFIHIMESFFRFLTTSRLYIWKKQPKKKQQKEKATSDSEVVVPRLSESKLKDLAWSLDINNMRAHKSNQ